MMGLLLLAAACGDQGGELRDATERRRAAAAEAHDDSVQDGTAPPDARIPAFVLNDSAPATAAPLATPADSTAAPAAPPAADSAPAAPAAQPLGEWTAGGTTARRRAGTVTLRGLRAGVNTGFDRVVLDFGADPVPGYRVEYIDTPTECGSGEPSAVAGGAFLAVTLRGAQAHEEGGRATVARERRVNMPILREMQVTCDFEGEVQVVLGTAARGRYRVTELGTPSRLIVDLQP
jgi:hypothetical protein